MRKPVVGALSSLLLSASLAWTQQTATYPPALSTAAMPWAEPACVGDPCVCPESERVWGSGEYLLWWIKSTPLPVPLATRGNAADNLPGVPGQPGTVVLFGGQNRGYDAFDGMRLTLGGWLDEEGTIGLEGRGFLLEQRSILFNTRSDLNGSPVLGRPLFDLLTANVFPFQTSVDGSTSGGDAVSIGARVWGAEANAAGGWLRNGRVPTTLLAGFRYLDFSEDLNFAETTVNLVPGALGYLGQNVPVGGFTVAHDRLQTRNQFYGGQVGFRSAIRSGSFFGEAGAKIALGVTHEVVTVSGNTTTSAPGILPNPAVGGVLAVPNNIGRYTRDPFAVLPEVELKIGYQVTQGICAFVGYNFLYLSEVVRPGDQIVSQNGLPVTNRAQIPTSVGFGQPAPAGPGITFNNADFWTQGVSFGISVQF